MADDPFDALSNPLLGEKRLSEEQFEALLLEVRNGASQALNELAGEPETAAGEDRALRDDVRAVWHAAELALGVLNDGYIPKREAVEKVQFRLQKWRALEE